MAIQDALILVVLFQIKHLFADFFLQTSIMLANRGVYFHLGRALHCLIHVLGSLICMLLVGIPLTMIALLCLLEWLLHFHIDYGKGLWSDSTGDGPSDAGYWRAFGTDQFLHHATYLGMVWLLI